MFGKKYVNTVMLDSCKDAILVSGMEGYGNVNVNYENEELFRDNKVILTIPTERHYISAVIRSLRYSSMGIMNCILKR